MSRREEHTAAVEEFTPRRQGRGLSVAAARPRGVPCRDDEGLPPRPKGFSRPYGTSAEGLHICHEERGTPLWLRGFPRLYAFHATPRPSWSARRRGRGEIHAAEAEVSPRREAEVNPRREAEVNPRRETKPHRGRGEWPR